MDDFAQIRQAHADGASIRALAQRFGRSPKTILKVLGQPEPVPYTFAEPRPAPTFGAFRAIVDDILVADRT